VVIPQEIRDRLGLKSGTVLWVSVEGDTVILRKAETGDAKQDGAYDEDDKSTELQKFLTD
jgi:AbrB family looped-hinge helix DNA binding protein